jgi:hypothetical protein
VREVLDRALAQASHSPEDQRLKLRAQADKRQATLQTLRRRSIRRKSLADTTIRRVSRDGVEVTRLGA